jgi:cbb3-type cytochrome c oxidase subunit III
LIRVAVTAAAGLAVAIGLAACSSGTGGLASGNGDAENGRKLFQDKCAGCHTLAAAGATGTIGPNLDYSFAQARSDGFELSAIREIVHEQIKYPGQFPVAQNNPNYLQANMPANLVKGKDAEDVASYVAENAGKQGFAEQQAISGANGKSIFTQKCGGCHTLAAAGTKGTQGPNLDQLKPPFAKAKNQVISGGGIMPAFKGVLSDKQIDAVARFVADNAGK